LSDADEPVGMDERRTTAGKAIHVARSEAERGSKAPFLVAYADPEGNRQWGYVCSFCDSTETAMDTMGRIKCSRCANVKKADEWDAAHE
jgi:hypothetical protein